MAGFAPDYPVTSKYVNNLYLYYYLIVRNIDNIIKRTTGLDAITFTDLGNLYVDIPSLEIQNYFVRSLQIIERIIRERQQTIENLNELVASVFIDMFGDPMINSKKLKKIKLSELSNSFKYGTSKKSIQDSSQGTPIIRIPNIQNGAINYDDLKYSELSENERNSLILKNGDLLFVRTNGNPDYIAKCAVFENKDELNYAFASYLIRVRLKENPKILPLIISDVVNSANFRRQIIRDARTSAGNYNINIDGLKGFSIICPDLEIQKIYIEFREAANNVKTQLTNSLSIIEVLFQSLLQKAFKGELEFEKEKILEDILPNLQIKELLSDLKLLKSLLDKLQKQDFKTGSNYKLAQNLLFQLLDNEKSGVFQQCDVETENLEIKYEAS